MIVTKTAKPEEILHKGEWNEVAVLETVTDVLLGVGIEKINMR